MSRRKRDAKTVFRRIVMDPAILNGRPHIPYRRRVLPVDEIVKRIARGASDADIRQEFGKMRDNDLLLCRAWQVRFAPGSLSREFARVGRQNVFMIDENMPANLLADVAKLFGRSSHVTAEGLVDDHNDDEKDIWEHMLRHKYSAILTADGDFTRIARRHRLAMAAKYGSLRKCPEHMPVVVHIKNGEARQHVLKLLKTHQDEILDYIARNDAAFIDVGLDGAEKRFTNFEIESEIRPARNRKRGPG